MAGMTLRVLRLGFAALALAMLVPFGTDSASAAGGWACPMKQKVTFGRGLGGGHQGVDMLPGQFPHEKGRKVRAVVSGTVTYHNEPSGYGYYISFEADAGRRFVYAHLTNAKLVANGNHVKRGDPIGRVGQSGNATAPHLHFEARRKVTDEVMDPVPKLGPCDWINPP
jgi:murein DD-endopeptidase MepM/ murein hydrolase activator NlpD